MIGIAFFFGAAALSMIAQRHGPPQLPVLVVPREAFERAPVGDNGFSIVILLAVIAAAVWFL